MTGIGENIAPVSLPCTRRTSSESRQSASESDGFSSNEAQCSSSYTSIVTQKNDTCSKESRDYEQVLNAVLVTPPIHVPTKDVFKALQGAFSQPLPPLQMDTTEALKTLLHNTRNDLEAPALRLFPALQKPLEILTQQHGCWLTRLSGSGATCFGLFETAAQATTAAHAIKKQHSDWWVQSTTLG
jgi:homoserine kinase